MVVQVQAAITQRRGCPTTLVAGDAWKYSRDMQKKPINPPNSEQHPHVFQGFLQWITTKVCYFVLLHCRLLFCVNLYSVDWLDGQSTWPIYAYKKDFIKAFMSDDALKLSHAKAISCPQWAMPILSVQSLASFVKLYICPFLFFSLLFSKKVFLIWCLSRWASPKS